jgi:GntR family transcriptional regulator
MNQIKNQIAAGELQPGDQLPTVRQLAADLRVNFNTIARAYRLLDENGIISTQHGRGTYILEFAHETNREVLRAQGLRRLTHRYLTEAARLGFSPDEVSSIFSDSLDAWKLNGEPPSPEE